jgi:hypothetical protein
MDQSFKKGDVLRLRRIENNVSQWFLSSPEERVIGQDFLFQQDETFSSCQSGAHNSWSVFVLFTGVSRAEKFYWIATILAQS